MKKDQQHLLEPLLDSIIAHLKSALGGSVIELALQLGDIVDKHLQVLHDGRVVDHYDDSLEPLPSSKYGKQQMVTNSSDFLSTINFSPLVTAIPSPNLSMLAIVLQEALNQHQNLPFANEITHRILLGQHPTQSSTTTHPPCQTNPICHSSEYACIFKAHLPGCQLTSREGISNLLSWMGTGQGYQTKPFLNSIAWPSGFYSSNIDELLDIF